LPSALHEELRLKIGPLCRLKTASWFNKQVRKLSGVERFHSHQLRHTFGCRWAEAGRSLLALQKIMGHANFQTTLRYAALSDAHVREEVARMEGRFVEDFVKVDQQDVSRERVV
jgi:integrase